jgi:hypothetical protein
MVFETTGKFQLVEGDVENFDKMMEAVGEFICFHLHSDRLRIHFYYYNYYGLMDD